MAGLSRSWESVSCCPLRNQIAAGERLDVRCLSINSTNRDTWPGLMGPIRDDQVDALLVSPERFANDDFVMDVLLPIADRIGLLVVDEVHCISDWGHAMPGRRVSLYRCVSAASRAAVHAQRAQGVGGQRPLWEWSAARVRSQSNSRPNREGIEVAVGRKSCAGHPSRATLGSYADALRRMRPWW